MISFFHIRVINKAINQMVVLVSEIKATFSNCRDIISCNYEEGATIGLYYKNCYTTSESDLTSPTYH